MMFAEVSSSPLLLLFHHLNIVCWEETKLAMTLPYPPSLVNLDKYKRDPVLTRTSYQDDIHFTHHLNVGYHIIGVKGYFILSHGLVVIQSNCCDATYLLLKKMIYALSSY